MRLKTNRRPTPELYKLAQKKFKTHEEIIAWFLAPACEGGACPQSLLNINADFTVKELLEKLENI